jgi:hypothetical protein
LTISGLWSGRKRRIEVFQASEGGSVSVGRRKFQSKTGATPTPAPLSRLEAAPRPMRGYGTDRISRVAGLTPISSAPLSREVVLSKTSLAGICLITFACGIVTTVMVDRARSRAGDQVAAREADPGLTRAAAEPAPIAPAPTPAATAPATPTAPSAAATDPLVVQMPNLDEASRARTIHAVPVAPVRPRVAEAAVAAPKSKPPTAAAPAAVALKTKAAAAPVASQVKPTPTVLAPAKAKPAVVATAAALPTKTKAAVAPGPDRAKPAGATVVKTKVAVAKPPANLKVPAVAKPPASAKPSAKEKKAKPAGEGSDPASGWVDPFTL